MEAAPVRALPTRPELAAGQRGLQRGLRGRGRTVVVFSDATILTETPPLRASWSLVGQQAEVPITGNRVRRVVFGALNPATGAVWLDESAKWNQDAFQNHLRSIRSRWRGWRLVLFLDRGSRTRPGSRGRWRGNWGSSCGSCRRRARN
ncbi:transposase [Gemmata sp.]|uniref:transposase n=1 Tax=Gemmata sp. TaxID=1914242 RepID=UPI003F70601D